MENQSGPHPSDNKYYWGLTVAIFWFQCIIGASWTLDNILSPALKSGQLGYHHHSTLLSFKGFGVDAGVVAGLQYAKNNRGKRRRIWVVMAAGAVLCFVGYFFIWAAMAGVISRPSLPVMCLFVFLAASGQAFFSSVNAFCGVLDFSGFNGIIVGMLKIHAVAWIQQFILRRAFSLES